MNSEPGGAYGPAEPAATKSAAARRAANPGELLRGTREQRGLSERQMADELHLDPKVIHALEANDFEVIGPAVYTKGYLRKYAEVLGLAADEVLAQYHAFSGEPDMPQVLPTATALAPGASRRSQSRVSLMRPEGSGAWRKWLWIVVCLALAGALGWLAKWLLERPGFVGLG